MFYFLFSTTLKTTLKLRKSRGHEEFNCVSTENNEFIYTTHSLKLGLRFTTGSATTDNLHKENCFKQDLV